MWISRDEYTRIIAELATAIGENKILREANAAHKTTLDWARVRLTQVEHERNQLLFNFTGVKVLTPTIEEAPPPTMSRLQNSIDQMPTFEDVGDEEAARLGLSWRGDGSVRTSTDPE